MKRCQPRSLGYLVQIVEPVDEDIGSRFVIRMAVTRQIDADEVALSEMGGKGQEAGAVVEPAVQGNDQWLALPAVIQQGDAPAIGQGEEALFHHHQRE